MTTDTKAVARWEVLGHDELDVEENGRYVLFTDHERVVANLTKNHKENLDSWLARGAEISRLRTSLAASRAEVEGLKMNAEQVPVGQVVEETNNDSTVCKGVLFATYILSDNYKPGALLYVAPPAKGSDPAQQQDAARWRWVREQSGVTVSVEEADDDGDMVFVSGHTPEELDVAIDAAMENGNV
jgi:hypothetical protein